MPNLILWYFIDTARTIYSETSISKLKIPSTTMYRILQKYAVHPDFIDILLGFRHGPHVAEGSSSFVSIRNGLRNELSRSYQL